MTDAYLLLDKLPEPIVCFSSSGIITYLNPEFAAIAPLAVAGVTSFQECFELSNERAAELLRLGWSTTSWQLLPLHSDQSSMQERRVIETSRVRVKSGASGGTDDLLLVRVPSRAKASGTFLALNQQIDSLNEEVSRRKRLEKEREELLAAERQARMDLEAMAARKDRFIAVMSHELRSPLNAILGWIQVLNLRGTRDEELAAGLEAMDRNAQGLAMLIQEIVDYERLASGKLRLEIRQLDLAELVRRNLQSYTPALLARNIRIELTEETAIQVAADELRLDQIVRNLMDNAIKFTPEGGAITVSIRKQEKDAVLSIKDTGVGIPDDKLNDVFKRFFQIDSKESRRTGGLGLGLSIVQMLTEMHGGTVEARSEGVGQGAELIVRIPLASELRLLPLSTMTGGAAPLQDIHIVLVDDLEDARDVLTRLLTGMGAKVEAFASSQEALTWFNANSADLIVGDIEMPGEDGYEMMRKIRTSGTSASRIPAIALTAHARVEDRERSFEAGFDAHMAKPVVLLDLVREVRRLLPPKPISI